MRSANRLTVNLKFDSGARDAVLFYISVFPRSRIYNNYSNLDIPFSLWGHKFHAQNRPGHGRFNPSQSLMVNFDPLFFNESENPQQAAADKLDEIWNKLEAGGEVIMPLGAYDFSPHFGWIQDRFGLSWQLILSDSSGDPRPAIIPAFMFTGRNYGKAEEAMNRYLKTFPEVEMGQSVKFPAGAEPEKEGTLLFADFRIGDSWLTVSDSAANHHLNFSPDFALTPEASITGKNINLRDSLAAYFPGLPSKQIVDDYGLFWRI